MSSTSITSTSGVVLMVAITSCSVLPGPPTLIAIVSYSSNGALPGQTRGAPLRRPAAQHDRGNLLADRRRRGSRRPRTAHSLGGHAGTAYQIGMQIAREVPQGSPAVTLLRPSSQL